MVADGFTRCFSGRSASEVLRHERVYSSCKQCGDRIPLKDSVCIFFPACKKESLVLV